MAVSETPSRNVITGFTKPFNDTKGRKKGNGDELTLGHDDKKEDEEDDGISCCKTGISFFPRCQRHSSILYGGNVQCSQRVENNNKGVSSLTEDMRATKD